jgi:hypothetical protein
MICKFHSDKSDPEVQACIMIMYSLDGRPKSSTLCEWMYRVGIMACPIISVVWCELLHITFIGLPWAETVDIHGVGLGDVHSLPKEDR